MPRGGFARANMLSAWLDECLSGVHHDATAIVIMPVLQSLRWLSFVRGRDERRMLR